MHVGIFYKKSGELSSFLRLNKIIGNDKVIRRGDFVYFPVIQKISQSNIKDLISKNKNVNFNFEELDFLDKIVQKQITNNLPAFDTLSDLAIIADHGSKEENKKLAKEILDNSNNINRVFTEIGNHHSDFRIQEIEFVAGNNKSSIVDYKENDVTLRFDASKVYFSPRLSTERRRIYEQVKDNEKVLVMFSGVGPYIQEISIHSKAKMVSGIELNPIAHDYSYINKHINRTSNTLPIYGDVREVNSNLSDYLFGFKSSIDDSQIKSRLKENDYSPHELYLIYDDLFEENNDMENIGKIQKEVHNIENLKNKIDHLITQKKNVFLHMPVNYNDKPLEYGDELIYVLNILGNIAREKGCNVIVHIHNKEDAKLILKRFSKFKKFFFYENLQKEMNTFEDFIALKDLIDNICLDVCHLGLVFKNNDEINIQIKQFYENFNLYYHLSDTKFNKNLINNNEGLEIDKGDIDFSFLKDYFTFGILECMHKDQTNPIESINSRAYLKALLKNKLKFDRIIMPLPKDANHFLDVTIPITKKNGIIHMYDFVHIDYFPEETINRFRIEAEKLKVSFKTIEVHKAGVYAPKKYRVCGDFKIL